ncbi:hypothetical protein FHS23_000939 [Prauserella isguenensis]|uniref:Uncharacterized protein n=1 Tax=Prauserella isguenensis TaxID=1470180 RepID=A0A839RY34_9PSEU|nr:hypothetical protein [Prauserella isguenensis]MBB3049944.1 hypothetical protein [Prauserella isguenensis]
MSGNEEAAYKESTSDSAGERRPASGDAEATPYLVLWGDAVAPKELGRSLILAVPVALAAFLLAQQVFSGTGNQKVADGYALLVGLAACVVTGAVCAKLFTPKRVFVESHSDDVRPDLAPELSSPEAVSGLPEQYIAEMREIGLYGSAPSAEGPARSADGPVDKGVRR